MGSYISSALISKEFFSPNDWTQIGSHVRRRSLSPLSNSLSAKRCCPGACVEAQTGDDGQPGRISFSGWLPTEKRF
jgi:hypothetical protein